MKISYSRADIEYLHPGRSAVVTVSDGTVLGYVGEVHPDVTEQLDIDTRVYIAELDMEYIVNNGIDIKPYKAISRYQGMQRDLALLAPYKLPAQEIIDTIYASCSKILEKAEVFDVYHGGQIAEDKKSVAVNLLFRDITKTLKEEEVNQEIKNVLDNLSAKGIILR